MTRVFGAFAVATSLAFASAAGAATYTVVNTTDAAVGSFRWAIDQVNLNPGPHRIVFSIPGSGVQTIHLLTPPAGILHTVAIDGTTQPQYNDVPLIELDGTGSDNSILIRTEAPHSSVKGLIFNRFPDTALSVSADACTVSACYFGTNAAGTAASPNGAFGILVQGDSVLIGGHTPPQRNIISANGFGVGLYGAQASVVGNYIGTDVTGSAGIGNHFWGIALQDARQAVIDGNVISASGEYGVICESLTPILPADAIRFYRNLIGTNASGQDTIPNLREGIYLRTSYTIIGDIGKGNVICGNHANGIYVDGGYSHYNQFRGNKIGVSADGTRQLGNWYDGIQFDQSHDNIIGGSLADGSGNQFGGNQSGVSIGPETAINNVVQGNAFGTSFNGALDLGHRQAGIATFADHTTVGGLGPLANIVAHNDAGGIWISGKLCTARGNAVFLNDFGRGIDLLPFGVTPNDSLDVDTGANGLQNYPVITAVSQVTNNVRLQGRLPSAPNFSYTVDFYSNSVCNPSGYGEGESWLGSALVNTNASGWGLFDVSFPLTSIVGYVFTCTATNPLGETSEFSPCAPLAAQTAVDPAPSAVAFAFDAAYPSPASGATALSFFLPRPARVTLKAYDVAGRMVRTLLDRDLPAGPNRFDWTFGGLGTGVYVCRLDARATDGSGERFQGSQNVVVLH